MYIHKLLVAIITISSATAAAKASSLPRCAEILSELRGSFPVTSLSELTIVDAQKPRFHQKRSSPPLRETDLIIQKMYDLKVVPDFKTLSDARKRDLTPEQTEEITENSITLASSEATEKLERMLEEKVPKEQALQQAATLYEKIYTINQFEKLYDTDFDLELSPGQIELVQTRLKVKLPKHPSTFDVMVANLFADSEEIWSQRLKKFNKTESGLPTPFDFIIAGERFREWYNWDTFFAVQGLLATKKVEVAKMITENFLDAIEKYGFVPNGGRDYYLDRSQPPFTSLMVVEIYKIMKAQDASRADRWLKERAYPLLVREYQYWMSDSYDPLYGLNHYWSSLNTPRPERYGTDDERNFGETDQQTRTAASSGKDFTATHLRRPIDLLSVKLNSLLWQYEMNLAFLSGEVGHSESAQFFTSQAANRKENFDRYLWDPKGKVWRDFDRLNVQRLDQFVTPDIYVPLFVGMANQDKATSVVRFLNKDPNQGGLLGRGGLIASNIFSGMQWDGPHSWPPHNIMALIGLKNYGYNKKAQRLAQNILVSDGNIKAETGDIYEKRNGLTGRLPVEDGSKYPNQKNLIWSHVEVIQALKIMGYSFE
jgi:alpha,alpha-trehalase